MLFIFLIRASFLLYLLFSFPIMGISGEENWKGFPLSGDLSLNAKGIRSTSYGTGSFFERSNPFPSRDTVDPLRFHSLWTGKLLFMGGSYYMLDRTWYQGHSRTSFHFFDDSGDWLQMDKAGHLWSAFHLSRGSSALWQWSGIREERAALYGAGVGTLFLTGVEVMDGFSKEWGFSLADAGSNLLGSAAFYLQKKKWGKAYFLPVFSYRPSSLARHRPGLLGSNFPERLLKDYNAQSYWINIDPELWGDDHPFPPWLALSVGYGAGGMLGGSRNPAYNNSGQALPSFDRTRRFYLSFDLLLKELPVEGKGWRTLFRVLDAFRFPFPALEYSPQAGFRGHLLGP